MKTNIKRDVIFSVEVNQLQDGHEEIVDDKYPIKRFAESIKRKTFVALDMSNFDKYMMTAPDDRIAFLKKNWDILY